MHTRLHVERTRQSTHALVSLICFVAHKYTTVRREAWAKLALANRKNARHTTLTVHVAPANSFQFISGYKYPSLVVTLPTTK